MQLLLRIFLEAVMGYLLQSASFVIGMHGIARQKMKKTYVLYASLICAVLAYLIRISDLFNFGVHTMLMLLIINAACIFLCRLPVRISIEGSIISMIMVLFSELINMGLLSIFYTQDEILALLAEPITKAATAIPGNLVLLLAAGVLYYVRVVRRRKEAAQ